MEDCLNLSTNQWVNQLRDLGKDQLEKGRKESTTKKESGINAQLLKISNPIPGLPYFALFSRTYKRGLFEACKSHPIVLFEELVKILLDTC